MTALGSQPGITVEPGGTGFPNTASALPSRRRALNNGTMHVLLRFALLVVLLIPAAAQGARTAPVAGSTGPTPKIKVACLGDSITFGARIDDRARHAYPVRLGDRLGASYEVRGFGASSRTLRLGADLPYATESVFQDALKWTPDVAVIVLGANDTVLTERRPNWVEGHDFSGDLKVLVAALRESNPAVAVWAAAPPPILAQAPDLEEARVKDLNARAPRLAEIARQVRQYARTESGVEFIDLMRVLRPEHSVDGVHPNPFGADRIALRMAAALRMEVSEGPGTHALLEVGPGVGEISATKAGDFHGFRRLDFKLRTSATEEVSCILVEPERAAAGRPWVWRMRFFGHQPGLDRDLLDRGYHLAYVDVANLYGAPAAVARMGSFYRFCVSKGLSKKPVLEGMSRGGLAAMQFAKAAPLAVSSIYLDNPVCDLRSWPGGRTGKRSDADWKRALLAWDLAEPAAWEFEGGPLSGLEGLAEAQVPIFLLMGQADVVVPPHENGERLVERYRALGGPMEVWRKPGDGHHPHGLHPVDPLLRAVLRSAVGDPAEASPAVTPQASVEYRAGAGWGKGNSWFDAAALLAGLGKAEGPVDVVFLGDSITQGLTGHGSRLSLPEGNRPFDRLFRSRRAVSLGLSGDRTEHLLHRIENGSLDAFAPGSVVLQIGVNNVNAARHIGSETFAGILAVVEALGERLPDVKVLVCGPFPAGRDAQGRVRRSLAEVRTSLKAHDFPTNVQFMDLWPLFAAEDGKLLSTMSKDGIHITAEGKAAWLAAVGPWLFD